MLAAEWTFCICEALEARFITQGSCITSLAVAPGGARVVRGGSSITDKGIRLARKHQAQNRWR